MTDKNKSTNEYDDNIQKTENEYDDDNIPEVDLPKQTWVTEPLPESTRPRKDGPGGDGENKTAGTGYSGENSGGNR